MSNASLDLLINEISHEISRDAKGWYFTQAAAARVCGMHRKTIEDGLEQPNPFGHLRVTGSKLLRSLAAQGISPAGLTEFKAQWSQGRVTDLMVSCLITYAATQKKGDKDPEVVALHGVMVAGGLRGLLDAAFGVEDVSGRVVARLSGIDWRIKYTTDLADRKMNIGAYTASVTAAVTGHPPTVWNNKMLPAQFGERSGRIRDHADPMTLQVIEACERAAIGMSATPEQAGRFAKRVALAAKEEMNYQGVQLSPARLTSKTTRDISAGKRSALADAETGTLFPVLERAPKE